MLNLQFYIDQKTKKNTRSLQFKDEGTLKDETLLFEKKLEIFFNFSLVQKCKIILKSQFVIALLSVAVTIQVFCTFTKRCAFNKNIFRNILYILVWIMIEKNKKVYGLKIILLSIMSLCLFVHNLEIFFFQFLGSTEV